MVRSPDTSGCSCIFVASPPFDAVPALLLCVSTHVMRAAVCQCTSRLSNVGVLLFCMCVTRGIHSRHSLAAFT